MLKKISLKVIPTVTAILCSLYVALFCCSISIARHGSLSHVKIFALIFFALAALFLLCISFFYSQKRKLLHKIHVHRYSLGIALIALLTIFKISGSSVASWSTLIGGENFQGTLWGIPRSIRSDEFIVFTPFAFSQAYTDYAPISNIIHASPTDVTMLYAQPAWAIATLFRPFLWGFMLFGSQHGLAFFWASRLVTLLLVSYEFGRWLTDDQRTLASCYGFFVGFSPIVQWWFAVNGTAELFIYGQLLVLLFFKYLYSDSTPETYVSCFAIAYCCGCYALILYPAWQISLFYVFCAIGIAVLIVHIQQSRQEKVGHKSAFSHSLRKYVIPMTIPMLFLIAVLTYILYQSRDTINLTMNTAYPGARLETGGGLLWNIFSYTQGLLGPLNADTVLPNICEQATFFSLFPMGIIAAVYCAYKLKDKILIALLTSDIILLTYGIVGFPAPLSKITLLSNVPSGRLQMATTFIDVILIFRSISLIRENNLTLSANEWFKRLSKHKQTAFQALLAIIAGAFITGMAFFCSTYYIRKSMLLGMFLILAFAMYLIIQPICSSSSIGIKGIALLTVFTTVTALCINPIQYGTAALTDNAMVTSTIKELQRSPNSVTLATSSPIIGQAFVANGIPTATSVNSVPDLDRWKKIDATGEYEDIYNRYAYVEINLKNSGKATFNLEKGHGDYIHVHLTADDLKKIGVTHFLTTEDLTKYDSSTTEFKQINKKDGFKLYAVN